MTWLIDMGRVAVSKPNTSYKTAIPEKLVAHLLSNLLDRNPFLNTDLGEIILANAFGTGGNMARYASLLANVSESVPTTTIDYQCAGGLKAIEMAHAYIKSGLRNCVIAGGMESKSLTPEKRYHKNDFRNIDNKPFSIAEFSPQKSNSLAASALILANKYGISKHEMQEWKANSEYKLHDVYEKGIVQENIFQFNNLNQDYFKLNSQESLQKLQSADIIDRTTAAGFADAAAIILFANEEIIKNHKLTPIARIIDSVSIGLDANISPEGAIIAAEVLLQKNKGFKPDYYQISESYAAIPLSFAKRMKIDHSQINPNGGEMAYGHPYGASGTIGFISLVQALKANNLQSGLVSYPAAGGLACSVLIEMI